MEKTNSHGQTLQAFLAQYDHTAYPHPAVTADCLIFCGEKVLLIRRKNHPYIGDWALPGGFLDPGESLRECAQRELAEETGLSVPLSLFCTLSTPGRDPRGWTVTVCFIGQIPESGQASGKKMRLRAADDALEAAWFGIEWQREGELDRIRLSSGAEKIGCIANVRLGQDGMDLEQTEIVQNDGIAFDHGKILLKAVKKI